MTPSQTQALQDVKDEVAKNHLFDSWSDLINAFPLQFTTGELIKWENEAMQLYHTRLLAEAGKEFPDAKQLRAIAETASITAGQGAQIAYIERELLRVRDIASALLAAKQGEIDKLKQIWTNKDKHIDELKAEAERFSQFKEWIDKMIEAEHRGGDLSYKQHRIVYEKIKEQITKPQ